MLLDIKIYPVPFIWLESWSNTMKGMTEENSRKNRSNWYHVKRITQLDWSKIGKHFSVNSHRKFLSWHEASTQAIKQVDFPLPLPTLPPPTPPSPPRQTLFLLLGSHFSDVSCTFHLGANVYRFLSIIFLFLLTFVSFRRHVSFSIS